ncbi:hypothetical protein [Sphingobacterium deserti]|uniref:Lipoprotein n=1 Tax=Sphingobacterium deserti TaxID=1229276 RepID=A0A0B8TBD7_9SPHI|nr:hypothetical protein [Sphingobacterium deserti]KGE16199.1 hypothetical protein DI53_0032 [Sphingobacterium deserti]
MKNNFLTLCIATALLLLTGCSKDGDGPSDNDDFVSLYGSKPFKGEAKGQRLLNGQVNYNWEGEARIALMEPTADSVSLLFLADFGDEGEINFKIRGAYNDGNFRAGESDPNSMFAINGNTLTGTIVNSSQSMNFNGSFEREKASVAMRVEFLEEIGAFPKNAILNLTFETSRDMTTDNGEGCEMRLVPIWSPSGVTMGMVPDC